MLEIKSLSDFDDEVFGGNNSSDNDLSALDGDARGGEKVITKLVSGVRDANRVNIFLDGKFAFSLDVAQVVELQVKVGQKVDAERLEVLRGASEFGKLYQRTLEWVLTRPHSIQIGRAHV